MMKKFATKFEETIRYFQIRCFLHHHHHHWIVVDDVDDIDLSKPKLLFQKRCRLDHDQENRQVRSYEEEISQKNSSAS